MKIVNLIFCLYLTANLAAAQPSDPPVKYGIDVNFGVPGGLKAGEKAPVFKAADVNGKPIDLTRELSKGNVVLIFYRGEWCPVCNRYLNNFQDSISYIFATGARVLAITPEKPASAEKMIEKTGATFTVIPDPTEQIMKDYNVLFNVTEDYQNKIRNALETDIASNNNKEDARLPVPATYIINQQGVIVYRQFDLDYHNRASVKDILDNLTR
jgi:peroxiredoxin